MKRLIAVVSLLTTFLFITGCSSTAINTQPPVPAVKSSFSWQKCAAVGGAVWGIPVAIGSLATGGIAAVAGALVSGIACAGDSPEATVHFEFGKYDLDMKDHVILDKVIEDAGEKGNIELVGFTCDIGTKEDNQRLSEDRALSVKKYLMKKGIPENRIVATGMGEKDPVAKNDSEYNRTKNRRVEVQITF